MLDELLVPGNQTAMSVLPEMLAGLNEVIPPAFRDRVLLRGDAHLGTVANLRAMREAGYHYLCPLYSYWSKKKLKEQVRGRRGGMVQHSGLRLYRPTSGGPLEVEDTAGTPESQVWLQFLQQPIQQRLRLAG